MSEIRWYWCLTHERPEAFDERDDPDNALGPYKSAEAARSWKQRNEERAEAWQEQDEAWEGTDETGERDDA